MKKKIATTVFALALVFGVTATNPVKKEIKVKESTITWVGKKVTGKHEGTINLKEGYFEMEGDQLLGGKFVIDMTSIAVTDLKAGKGKEKLEGHLNTDDFFGTSNHPTATFEILSASKNGNGYRVGGTLTIKGISISYKVNMVKDGNTFTAKFVIDRTKYGITYKSGSIFDGLKDAAINDEFELSASLTI